MSRVRQAIKIASDLVQTDEFQDFTMNAEDFVGRKAGTSGSSITEITQSITSLSNAAMRINSSQTRQRENSRASINVISPVVMMQKSHRSWFWVPVTIVMLVIGILGARGASIVTENLPGPLGNGASAIFGWPWWLLVLGYALFNLWKNSYVMVPDGCEALIERFGKVVRTVGAGRHTILNPWMRAGYIVNTTKEYPYNAPIREAPTMGQVNASVDLFLQFRINDPREFIYRLGGVPGFSEKLQNAISEQTRALIYSQRAEEIYDLVGESTSTLLDSLNEQFLPSVEFVSANITHAEPSSQEYRMDLAAAEMIRVAKEAYNYKYALDLRKKQDEGDLDRELAGLRETLSGIQAEIGTADAKIKTAQEKAENRANAYAQQLMIEAESLAKANAALYEAQALDIRARESAQYPEILEYQYKQQILDRIENAAGRLPQLVNIGQDENNLDYVALAREMLGIKGNASLYSDADLVDLRGRVGSISSRIENREKVIAEKLAADDIAAQIEEVA